MTPTDSSRRRAVVRGLALVSILIVVALGGFALYVKLIVQPRAGDIPSGVACRDLPSLTTVERALEQQSDLVEQIEAIGAVSVIVSTCESGAEIAILVPSKSLSDEVVAILEDEPFVVPVSIRNV